MIFNFFFYDCFTVWYPVQWNLYNETDKVLLKHINFIICLAQSLHNYICFPCRERPPVVRDHKIWWSLYTGLYRFHCNKQLLLPAGCLWRLLFLRGSSWSSTSGRCLSIAPRGCMRSASVRCRRSLLSLYLKFIYSTCTSLHGPTWTCLDHHISTVGFHILVRQLPYIESGPRL